MIDKFQENEWKPRFTRRTLVTLTVDQVNLTKTNQHVKYESSVINSSQNNKRTPFYKSDHCDCDI